jgi:hypothetical protein
MIGGHGLRLSDSGWRLVAGSCGHGIQPSYSIKDGEFYQRPDFKEGTFFTELVT